MEARLFFSIDPSSRKSTNTSLGNADVIRTLASTNKSMFGTSLATREDSPQEESRYKTLTESFRNSGCEHREDLYLQIPAPEGSFVGIKWRGKATDLLLVKKQQHQSSSSSSMLKPLLDRNVEVKVSPAVGRTVPSASSSSSSSSSSPTTRPNTAQHWVKLRASSIVVDDMTVAGRDGAKSNKAVTRGDDEVQALSHILGNFLLSLTSKVRCGDRTLSEGLVRSLKAASDRCFALSDEQNRSFAASLRLFSVAKSRRDLTVVGKGSSQFFPGGLVWNLEEADLRISDVTPMFLPSAVMLSDVSQQAKMPEKQQRRQQRLEQWTFRSWCAEPLSSRTASGGDQIENVARNFVESCKTSKTLFDEDVTTSVVVGSYPDFLAQL